MKYFLPTLGIELAILCAYWVGFDRGVYTALCKLQQEQMLVRGQGSGPVTENMCAPWKPFQP